MDALAQITFDLRVQIKALQREQAEYAHSFELYHEASTALMRAFIAAHPDWPADTWPDATQVNVWAVEHILKHGGGMT